MFLNEVTTQAKTTSSATVIILLYSVIKKSNFIKVVDYLVIDDSLTLFSRCQCFACLFFAPRSQRSDLPQPFGSINSRRTDVTDSATLSSFRKKTIGAAFLIPHAGPPCYFLSDPWVPVYTQGSRPLLKPGAIKMTNGRLYLFFPLQTSQPKRGRREVLRTSGEP